MPGPALSIVSAKDVLQSNVRHAQFEMILLVSYTRNYKTGGVRHPHRLKETEMNNLNGSEKQIAWATDIRKEFIEKTKADMRSADKNDVLDMKAMLKVADNITEADDWINARRNVKIMFFDRADFWEARREIKATEKLAEKEDSGKKLSIRDMLKAKIAEKDGDGASV